MPSISYKNIQINYTSSGSGTCLVFLHGFLENQKMWNYYVDIFQSNYQVLTIDLLGHGQTECIGYIHTMEDMADAVYAVLQNQKIKQAILVGHSMGGYVALAMAELYPETVLGMILLNSTALEDSSERKMNRLRAIKAVKQNYATFISMSIANLFSEENRTRLVSEIEQVKLEALQTPLQGIIAALEGMKIRKDRQFILQHAPFPSLLILGAKDPVLPFEENKKQVEGTTTQLITLADGHMSTIENQQELVPIFDTFFTKC